MKISKLGYFRSLAEELASQSNRVRQLIGDAHWGHDGRHKEVLLHNLIRRYCPSSTLVSTGFVVSSSNPEVRSTEQDLLVIDTTIEAPLFRQGDLVIAFPHTVVAAISVKSKMTDSAIQSVVEGLATVRKVSCDCNIEPHRIWCAGFFYDIDSSWASNPTRIYKNLKKHILKYPAPKPIIDNGDPHFMGPDVIVDALNLAYLLDYERSSGTYSGKIRGYACSGTATAVFLSCLLEHIVEHFKGGHSVFSDILSDLEVPALKPPTFTLFP
jgi:hypothetical protein